MIALEPPARDPDRGCREAMETMMPVTYYVVVPFDIDASGELKPGEAKEVASSISAKRTALSLSSAHAGAVAFARTGDPATGEFEDAVILDRFGTVDLDALSG
jgi:hypothetical protein